MSAGTEVRFRVEATGLEVGGHYPIVKYFDNYNEALDYYNSLEKMNKYLYMDIGEEGGRKLLHEDDL